MFLESILQKLFSFFVGKKKNYNNISNLEKLHLKKLAENNTKKTQKYQGGCIDGLSNQTRTLDHSTKSEFLFFYDINKIWMLMLASNISFSFVEQFGCRSSNQYMYILFHVQLLLL